MSKIEPNNAIDSTRYYSLNTNGVLSTTDYYEWGGWTTGVSVDSTHLLTPDINNDGKSDIVILLWQHVPTAGEISYLPSPDRLIILESTPSGYVDRTDLRFGTNKPVSIGGTAWVSGASFGDLNGDGTPDLVFAVNRDDGRGYDADWDKASQAFANAIAMISSSDGEYKVVKFPGRYYFTYSQVTTFVDRTEVWLSGIGDKSAPVYGSQYSNTQGDPSFIWNSQMSEFINVGLVPLYHTLAIPNATSKLRSTEAYRLIVKLLDYSLNLRVDDFPAGFHHAIPKIGIADKKNDGSWDITDSKTLEDFTVKEYKWNGEIKKGLTFNSNGSLYVSTEAHMIANPTNMFPGSPDVYVVNHKVIKLRESTVDSHLVGDQVQSLLEFFMINDDNVLRVPVKFSGSPPPLLSHRVEFLDINNDSLLDIAMSGFPVGSWPRASDAPLIANVGGAPTVYLNSGTGFFSLVDFKNFPIVPQWGNVSESMFLNADGDSFPDLLYRPSCSGGIVGKLDWLIFNGTGLDIGDTVSQNLTILDRIQSSKIHTWAGNDLITDTNSRIGATTEIDGGFGIDISAYSGRSAQYKLTLSSGTALIVDQSSARDHSDMLTNIERLKFSDKSIAIDLDGNAGNAARTLATVFGKDALKKPIYAGMAIDLFDQGYTKDQVSQVLLDAVLGTKPQGANIVSLLEKNLTDKNNSSGTAAELSRLFDSFIAGTITSAQLVSNAASLELASQVGELAALSKAGWEYIPMKTKPHGSYADLPDTLYQFFVVGFGAAPGVTYMDQMAEAYRYWLPEYKDGTVKQIVEAFTTKTQFTSVYPQSLYRMEGGKYYLYAYDYSQAAKPLVKSSEVSKAVFDTQMASLARSLVDTIVKTSASEATKSAAAIDVQAALGLGGDWTIGKVIYTVFGNLASKPPTDAEWAGTAKQFANQVAVAKYYTDTLSQSTDDVATLRSVMAAVSNTTDVSSADAIASLIGVALLNGPGI